MKKLAIGAGLGVVAALAVSSAFATETITKYETNFTYLGNNTWSVTPLVDNAALHNIGATQSWLCNANNVGPGVSPCVRGQSYTTNGDIFGDRSCVYIQGDSPAWDTVPNTEKEVCAPLTPVTPTPTETPVSTPEPTTPVVTPEPTPTPETPAKPPVEPEGTPIVPQGTEPLVTPQIDVEPLVATG
jgi:hypothetical protein